MSVIIIKRETAKNAQGEGQFPQQMVLENWVSTYRNNEIEPLWIKDLNITPDTVKLLK